MKISVIIPVKTKHLAEDLLDCIEENTRKPQEVLILDGIEPINIKGYTYTVVIRTCLLSFACRIIQMDMSNTTNEAWTLGISAVDPSADAVAIFNDDILIDRYFFEAVENIFIRHPGAGIVMATPARSPDYIEASDDLPYPRLQAHVTKAMHGYCFVMRKSILDNMPPIPENVRTWYGDNWIWVHAKQQGYHKEIIGGVYVYHYGGRAIEQVKSRVGKQAVINAKEADRLAYKEAIKPYTEGNK